MASSSSHPIRHFRVSLYAVVMLFGVWPAAVMASEPGLVVVVPPSGPRADVAWNVHEALRVQLAALPNVVVLPDELNAQAGPAAAFVQARHVAHEHHATAVVWLDRDGDELSFFVWDAETQQSLRRRLPQSGAQAQATEQTAAIVRWAIQGLVDRQVLVLEQVTVAPPAAPPKLEPAVRTAVTAKATESPAIGVAPAEHDHILLWLAYTGGNFAPTVAWHDGLLAGVGVPVGIFSISATYKIVPTLEIAGAQTQARVSRHPFELRLLAQKRSKRFSLWGGAAVGVDASTRSTTAVNGASLVAAESRTSFAVGVGPQAAVSFALQGRVNLYLGLGVDIMVRSVRYHEEANVGDSVLAPHNVQARAECGLVVSL